MAGVGNQPDDIVIPCKANKVHTLKILVRWEDDLTPVPTANFEIYRGNSQYTTDMVAKGKYGESKVPPGSYQIFFPEIDESEIVEG